MQSQMQPMQPQMQPGMQQQIPVIPVANGNGKAEPDSTYPTSAKGSELTVAPGCLQITSCRWVGRPRSG